MEDTIGILAPSHRIAKYKEELDAAGLKYTVAHIPPKDYAVTVFMEGRPEADVENVMKKVAAFYSDIYGKAKKK